MTRYLVDTHVALWWLADDKRLSPTSRETIAVPTNEPFVSAASLWEIAIKRRLGKLQAPAELPDILLEEGFGMLPISAVHTWAVQDLPLHHRDPFDRLLVAQATVEALPIVTADPDFSAYESVRIHW